MFPNFRDFDIVSTVSLFIHICTVFKHGLKVKKRILQQVQDFLQYFELLTSFRRIFSDIIFTILNIMSENREHLIYNESLYARKVIRKNMMPPMLRDIIIKYL